MNYTLEKIPDAEMVKVTVDGTLNQDKRKEIHLNAMHELAANGYHRLLIDVSNSRLSSDYSTGDSLEMMEYMKRFQAQHTAKIAYVSICNQRPRQTFVHTAQLIGEINIKHFCNHDEAVAWLCQD